MNDDALLRLLTQAYEGRQMRISAGGITLIAGTDECPLDMVLGWLRHTGSDAVNDIAWGFLRDVRATIRQQIAQDARVPVGSRFRDTIERLGLEIADLRYQLVARTRIESAWPSGARLIGAEVCIVGSNADGPFAYSGQYKDEDPEQFLHAYVHHDTVERAIDVNRHAALYRITEMPQAAWYGELAGLEVLCAKCELLRMVARRQGVYPLIGVPPTSQLVN